MLELRSSCVSEQGDDWSVGARIVTADDLELLDSFIAQDALYGVAS